MKFFISFHNCLWMYPARLEAEYRKQSQNKHYFWRMAVDVVPSCQNALLRRVFFISYHPKQSTAIFPDGNFFFPNFANKFHLSPPPPPPQQKRNVPMKIKAICLTRKNKHQSTILRTKFSLFWCIGCCRNFALRALKWKMRKRREIAVIVVEFQWMFTHCMFGSARLVHVDNKF